VATEYVTHRDLDALRAEFRGEFALLRGEMKDLRGEFRGEIAGVRGEIAGVRGEIGSLRSRMDALPTTRTMVLTNVGAMIGVATLVLAAARFA
jgi:hypothetical protein